MITVDMPALQQSIARWNSSIAGKIDMLQVNGQGVVKVEAGRLVQTLIKVTPPKRLEDAREKVAVDVWRVFGQMGETFQDHGAWASDDPKHGHGEVYWSHWDDQSLTGYKRQNDKRGADENELRALYLSMKARPCKKNIQYLGMRGKQGVYVKEKFLLLEATKLQVVKHFQNNVGRAKAGWMIGWNELGKPGGIYTPPAWVTRHASGARGGCDIRGLGDPRYPRFEIENHAKGIGSAMMNQLAIKAMQIRCAAMVERMKQLLEHPELAADEASTQQMELM
jgi:hypothetical protein